MSNPLQDAQLQKFAQIMTQKQMFQAQAAELTSECWDKCVTYVGPSKMDSRTQSCMSNCVERFIDASNYVTNRLTSQSQQPAAPKESSGGWLYK